VKALLDARTLAGLALACGVHAEHRIVSGKILHEGSL